MFRKLFGSVSEGQAEKKALDLLRKGLKEDENGEVSNALSLFKEALSVLDEGHVVMTRTKASALHNIGWIYWDLDDFAESERFSRQALEIKDKTPLTRGLSEAQKEIFTLNFGTFLNFLCRESDIVTLLISQFLYYNVALRTLGSSLIYQGKLNEAEGVMKSAVTVFKKLNSPPKYLCLNCDLTTLYRYKESYLEAEQYSRKALDHHLQVSDKQGQCAGMQEYCRKFLGG
eukprot:m.210558 g.210558  ORF g.210558 m.210558 type:complete len:230 (+) comp39745_c0_seq102:44-733(+)